MSERAVSMFGRPGGEMDTVKKCSNCEATVDAEGTVKAGVGNIVPTMQVDENGMGPDVKECYKRGICPCCLQATLASAVSH